MAYLGVKPAGITSATEAEIAGDLTVDTNTLHVDAANNHVGVGTASPSLPLHINGASAGDGLVYSRSGTEYFRIDDTGTDMNIKTTGGGHQIIFTTNSSEVGRWRNGGGLTFNGDTAAANALDDYEVGSLSGTPTVGTNMTGTLSFSAALYVKVGDLVHIEAQIQGGSVTSSGAESSLVLTLPFATSVNSSAQVFNVWWTNARSNGWAVSNTSGDATGLFVAISPELNTSTGSTSVNVSGTYRAA